MGGGSPYVQVGDGQVGDGSPRSAEDSRHPPEIRPDVPGNAGPYGMSPRFPAPCRTAPRRDGRR
ncbi:hypothetical protein ACFV1N_45810 [Streptosporangium canum]|uniref:hypothetical protein n=1 Tax=Streptosporangium canum TaxID=324952 RepID=UPI0036A3CD32